MARKIFSFIMLLIVLGSGFFLELKMNEYRVAKVKTTEVSNEVRKGRDVDFDKLLTRNKDVKAWIYLPDSAIDYPVVQGEDNDYYLHRDINREYIYDGSIFIDARADPFKDFVTVIYGHRMSSGAMFHDLTYYKNEDYWTGHERIQLETPDGSQDILVTAYMEEMADSEIYAMEITETFEEGFYTKEDFISFVHSHAKILKENLSEDERYTLLSTCAKSTGDERIQIIGKIVEPEIQEVEKETITDKYPFINLWLVLQVLVGAVMATIAALTIKSYF